MLHNALILMALLLTGCGSDLPEESYKARLTSEGLAFLGRGEMACACRVVEGQVTLACEDSDVVGDPRGRLTTFYFDAGPYRNVRHLTHVAWDFTVLGEYVDGVPDAGMAVVEVGSLEIDRRGGDHSSVWMPFFIHQMAIESADAWIADSPAMDGGTLEGGRYWCLDPDLDAWDIDPSWRRTP